MIEQILDLIIEFIKGNTRLGIILAVLMIVIIVSVSIYLKVQ